MEALYVLILIITVTEIYAAATTADKFDTVMKKMESVNAKNCALKSQSELQLPMEYVSHAPTFKNIRDGISFSNRSVLRHVHSMALNRAYYYSFIYKMMDQVKDFNFQPGVMYLYMSSAADVSANPGWADASSLLFDKNCMYPNWFGTVEFNRTLLYFGPRAVRVGRDWNANQQDADETRVEDYAITPGIGDQPYKYCPFARNDRSYWWPDENKQKTAYTVYMKRSSQAGQFETDASTQFQFYGPPIYSHSADDTVSPVMTPPYFDCGRTNRWVVSMSAPVSEFMVRYNPYTHIRRNRYTAVAGVDVDFINIDINQCPVSEGNPAPNAFAGTHKCRPTTECQPLSGYGMKRGGYQCACLPGHRYPAWQEGPFRGEVLELNSGDLDRGQFHCIKVTNESQPDYVPSKFPSSPFYPQYIGETKELRHDTSAFDSDKWNSLSKLLKQVKTVTELEQNQCGSLDRNMLSLPEKARYGVHKQFEGQGRSALRLANFLSNYLQNVPEEQHFADFANMKADKVLQDSHVYGEVVALVMADPKVLSAGVLFDKHAFTECHDRSYVTYGSCFEFHHRELFAPYAYKTRAQNDVEDTFKVVDKAGFAEPYTKESIFSSMKAKWTEKSTSLTANLTAFSDEFILRLKPFNVSTTRIQHTAIYHAPGYEDGEWSAPQFKCDMVKGWVVTYTVPFFGRADTTHRAQFKGVVSVDVKFEDLDINQCPSGPDVHSAFSNTAKCDYKTQFCIPAEGRGFVTGSYRCECRTGYQTPVNVTTLDGNLMEQEFQAKISGESNRYDSLSCDEVPQVTMTSTTPTVTTTDDQTSGCSSVTYISTVTLIYSMFILALS